MLFDGCTFEGNSAQWDGGAMQVTYKRIQGDGNREPRTSQVYAVRVCNTRIAHNRYGAHGWGCHYCAAVVPHCCCGWHTGPLG
jgi:hypothetical protein